MIKRYGGLYLVLLYAVTICRNDVVAIQVSSTGPQTIKKPQGESVTLGCTYTQSPADVGELDVEWSIVSPDMTQKDQLILSYAGGQEYKLGNSDLMSRLKFAGNPSQGDATITITSIKVADTATYQCKVKKPPGIDSLKTTLVVLVRPSVPKCWVEAGEDTGSTVSMLCKSSVGSIPLTYTWTRLTGGPMPLTTSQNPLTGQLLIYNHSQSYRGDYQCTVSNEVGTETCKSSLNAYNPTSKAGVIAGAVIGALLLLLLLLLLIWLLCCCYQKRRYEKDTANEIREDAAAPVSRPSSRMSSFRSIMGYHPHQGLSYNPVRSSQLKRASTSHRSVSFSQNPVPPQALPKYDTRYGYAV